MNKKFWMVMIVAVLMVALLAACERPASTAPASTTPGAGEIPFPVTQPTTSVSALGTQTAIAKNPQATATGAPAVKATTAATAAPAQPTQAPAQPVQPVATAQPEIVIPTVGRPSTYQIQQGDHFYCIARRFNLNPEEFFSLNGLGSNSQAVVGQTVKIPSGGSWPSGSGSRVLKSHPDTYTVQAGDTLNKIACMYGDVDPSGIIALNELKSSALTAGQTLKIP